MQGGTRRDWVSLLYVTKANMTNYKINKSVKIKLNQFFFPRSMESRQTVVWCSINGNKKFDQKKKKFNGNKKKIFTLFFAIYVMYYK